MKNPLRYRPPEKPSFPGHNRPTLTCSNCDDSYTFSSQQYHLDIYNAREVPPLYKEATNPDKMGLCYACTGDLIRLYLDASENRTKEQS